MFRHGRLVQIIVYIFSMIHFNKHYFTNNLLTIKSSITYVLVFFWYKGTFSYSYFYRTLLISARNNWDC